jgi:hypothetical protein
VHVLEQIHRWLRPGGVLLDIHPEPENPSVSIGRHEIGWVDNTPRLGSIRSARAALSSVVEQGLFARERAIVFDYRSRFASVDDWLEYRQARRATSSVDPALIDRARQVMSAEPGATLVVSEHVLATRLARL